MRNHIEIASPDATDLPYIDPLDIRVLYKDDSLLVTLKPAGLLSVPGRGPDKQDCLSARIQRNFPDALVVHRLDMATSGLMLMARSPQSQRYLQQALSSRLIEKHYVAIVDGLLQPPADDWGLIDLPIGADWNQRPLRQVDPVNGKQSQTRWRVLDQMRQSAGGFTTRVELVPITGRTHQLRLHMQALGHPILGDALYATGAALAKSPRLLLHASTLKLAHPRTAEPLYFTCPPEF